jgi:calcineurin-like phosphoesterase family protein
MTVWFTSDQHWNHSNIIRYCNRPFDDVVEMDKAMIERWNERVTNQDIVYHLGDFTMNGITQFSFIFNQLHGKHIHLVPGGHDKVWLKRLNGMYPGRLSILPQLCELKLAGVPPITLCHYPMLSWEKSHYGALHLHGHSHGTVGCIKASGDIQLPPGEHKGFRVDVGVDCWDFYPVTLEQIMDRVKAAEAE